MISDDEQISNDDEIKIDEKTINKIIMEEFIKNPYPCQFYSIKEKTHKFTNMNYYTLLAKIFSRLNVEKMSIDVNIFTSEFELFLLNKFDDSNVLFPIDSLRLINSIPMSIDNNYLFLCLIEIIHNFYNIIQYDKVIERFMFRPTQKYAEKMVVFVSGPTILKELEICRDKSICIHNFFDERYTKENEAGVIAAIQYIYNSNVQISSNKLVSSYLLKFAINIKYYDLLEYLLDIGCRPDTFNVEIISKKISIIEKYYLSASEIYALAAYRSTMYIADPI